ncbi:MAG: hypothetical protein M3Q48_11290 [Actinomycetota bacterium]|nr:hypothetical protein [Actinomycetota bacterium]
MERSGASWSGAFVSSCPAAARRSNRSALARLVAATVAVVVLVACGDREHQQEAKPAPHVTTFEEGTFDDLPQFSRSEPVGPRSEKDGVVARSYRARGATPEGVLDYYRDVLDERGWTMVGAIERIGVGTYRADWVSGAQRLRVSASGEPQLAEDVPSQQVTVQYSLTLRPT